MKERGMKHKDQGKPAGSEKPQPIISKCGTCGKGAWCQGC